jgi:hypothetical protein
MNQESLPPRKSNKKKTLTIILVIIGVLLVSGVVLSYFALRNTDTQEAKEPEATITEGETSSVETSNLIWMCGRSVMTGWFNYWGADTTTQVKKEGYTLVYEALYEPPDIVDSLGVYLKDKGDKKPAVFFKLCFVDFLGRDRNEASQNLAEHKKYIQDAYNLVVKKYKLKLLIGNGLPQVKNDTTADLVWNYEQYNQWLEEFAASHKGEVAIFDFYGVLADSSGNLKAEYAVGTTDSHPNAAAYQTLDKKFFPFLKENLQ